MTTLQYFKEEGWQYYRSWPGIWPTLLATGISVLFYFVIPDCNSRQEIVKAICGSPIAVTGIMLALAVAAITFQIGTFTVQDLRHFVGSEKAMKDFDVIRASAKWTIHVLIASFISSILIFALSKLLVLQEGYSWLLLGLAVFILVLAISHVCFAIRAAFDFANVKVAIAKALEEAPSDTQKRDTE